MLIIGRQLLPPELRRPWEDDVKRAPAEKIGRLLLHVWKQAGTLFCVYGREQLLRCGAVCDQLIDIMLSHAGD